MNKKLIRLTESDLHNIVKESVNKILSEMDWKTYANARDKQPLRYSRELGSYDPNTYHNRLFALTKELEKQGHKTPYSDAEKQLRDKESKMRDRAWKFNDAAKDNFLKDYGFEDETGKISAYDLRSDYGRPSFSIKMTDKEGNEFGRNKYFVTNQDFYGQNGQHQPGKWCIGTVGWAGAVPASQDFDSPEEAESYGRERGLIKDIGEPSERLKSAFDKAHKLLRK